MEDDTNIRRIGEKDRKAQLKAQGPLFPEAQADRQTTRRSSGAARVYNLITALFLLGTVAMIAYTALIFTNPYSPLNPLPPSTLIPVVITATPTETPPGLFTPTPDITPPALATPENGT